jgi:hypothetical protein
LQEIAWLKLASIFAGGGFAVASCYAAGCLIAPGKQLPKSIRFTTGAAFLSLCLFLLLSVYAGYRAVFIGLGLALIIVAWLRKPAPAPTLPLLPPFQRWFFRIIFAVASAFYLIYAIGPDMEPDSVTYHLGLVAGYLRTHGLSRHVTFYEVLPQSVELLFAPAFAIGAQSAAKLVHFAFLLSVVPLIRHAGEEAGISPLASASAAALLFLSPVAAVAGTSAYTDLALVASCCSVFYLLARWRREPSAILLFLAGVQAGFCYTVKPTFGHVALAALAYVAVCSSPARARSSMTFVAGVALTTLPWLLRSIILTGNPFAPMLNTLFPHDGLDPAVDAELLHFFSPFSPNFRWHSLWVDYTIRGGNQGLLGPAFLLLPCALFALRTQSGRRLLAFSLLLALPFFTNTGTRFLMPASAPAAMALASVLPGPAALALVAVQAVGAIRPVTAIYNTRADWRLPELPLEAALRLEPERDYLHRTVGSAWANDVLQNSTPRGAKIFLFENAAEGYLDREVLGYWHSAQAERIRSAVVLASLGPRPCTLLAWTWAPGEYRQLRITATRDQSPVEAQLLPRDSELHWQTVLRKQNETLILTLPEHSSGANILSAGEGALPEVEALTSTGVWRKISDQAKSTTTQRDLRRDATAFMTREGYPYILISTANGPFAPAGQDMTRNAAIWGVKRLNYYRDVSLFGIHPPSAAESVPNSSTPTR